MIAAIIALKDEIDRQSDLRRRSIASLHKYMLTANRDSIAQQTKMIKMYNADILFFNTQISELEAAIELLEGVA